VGLAEGVELQPALEWSELGSPTTLRSEWYGDQQCSHGAVDENPGTEELVAFCYASFCCMVVCIVYFMHTDADM